MVLVSVGRGDVPANGISYDPATSADGRHVVFKSYATNLASRRRLNIYVRDAVAGTTELVSVGGTPFRRPGPGGTAWS